LGWSSFDIFVEKCYEGPDSFREFISARPDIGRDFCKIVGFFDRTLSGLTRRPEVLNKLIAEAAKGAPTT
jgi:hypothetical protein